MPTSSFIPYPLFLPIFAFLGIARLEPDSRMEQGVGVWQHAEGDWANGNGKNKKFKRCCA
jgi:hypothetical protein